jgi:hypothetical protein
MIELTEQQMQALEDPEATPPRVVNPRTKETFVLLRIDEYERLRSRATITWSILSWTLTRSASEDPRFTSLALRVSVVTAHCHCSSYSCADTYW